MSSVIHYIHDVLGTGTKVWKSGSQVSWAITFTCELAFILFGIEQGVFGNLTSGDDFLATFGNPTDSYLGIIVSIYTLGCFFGCILNYFIGDALGRKLVILFAMILITIGVILQTTAGSGYHIDYSDAFNGINQNPAGAVAHLMIGRFITGLGTGLETSSVPMFQAEMAKPERRGRLTASEALFVGIGLVYAYWLTYGLSFTTGSIAWRLPVATQIIFAVTVFGACLTIPESPRYLFSIGRNDEARATLSYVFGKPEDDPEIEALYQEIEEAMALETMESKSSWKHLFKKDIPRTRHRLILSYMSMFAQQLSGVNLINYYITTVLIQNVGLSKNLAMILGGCCIICFAVGSLVPSFFADSLGRRKPMVWGHFGCFVCMLLISALLSQQDTAHSASTGAAAVAFFFLFELVFGASANCLPWVIVPELLPLHARNKGTALGISANWLWNFFVVEITPTIIARIKWKSYLIFTFTNLAFVFMFYFFYPETKNLTLEAIDTVFVEEGGWFMGFVNTSAYIKSDIEIPQTASAKHEVEYVERAGDSSTASEVNDKPGELLTDAKDN